MQLDFLCDQNGSNATPQLSCNRNMNTPYFDFLFIKHVCWLHKLERVLSQVLSFWKHRSMLKRGMRKLPCEYSEAGNLGMTEHWDTILVGAASPAMR